MPIVMEGYVAVRTTTLATHAGHTLGTDASGTVLHCERCRDAAGAPLVIEREYRSTSLPCGCGTADEHAEGIAIQERMRKAYRFPRSTCVGCALGDDGPSIHSCYIHPIGG